LIKNDFSGPLARITVEHDRKLNTRSSVLLLALADAFAAVPAVNKHRRGPPQRISHKFL